MVKHMVSKNVEIDEVIRNIDKTPLYLLYCLWIMEQYTVTEPSSCKQLSCSLTKPATILSRNYTYVHSSQLLAAQDAMALRFDAAFSM